MIKLNRQLKLVDSQLKTLVIAGLFLVCLFYLTNPSEAAISKTLNYQGQLKDQYGVLVADSNYTMTIRLYDAPTGGSCLWSARGSCGTPQTRSVATVDGVFSIILGDTGAGDNALNLDFSSQYYLSIQIAPDGTEMSPRKAITSVPQAFNANSLIGDGRINLANTVATNPALNITYNPTSGANSAAIFTYGSAGGTGTALNVTQAGSGLAMRINDDGTLTDSTPFVIEAGGNVGIGTTNPGTYKLNVVGNTYLNGTVTAVTSVSSPIFQGISAAVTFGNASYATTITGSGLTVVPTAWTATPTISGLITATSGLTSNGTLTANGQVVLGDGGDDIAINSNDWDISSAGAMSGITTIAASGEITSGGYLNLTNDNLLHNGDFETNTTDGWSGVTSITTGGYSGNYTAQVTGSSSMASDDYIPVDPTRDVIQLEAYVKKIVAGTTPGILYFGYYAYDSSKTIITTAPCGTYCYFATAGWTVPVDGAWHKVSATTSGEGTVYPNFPVGTKYIRVLGLVNYGASGDAVTQIDHISLKKINTGPLFVGNNFSSNNLVDQYQVSKIYTTSGNILTFDPASGGNLIAMNSSGNLGIGTTNPGQKLHIKDGTSGTFLGISEDTVDWSIGMDDGSSLLDIKYEGTDFATFNSNGQIWLGMQGNVGIGTTSPMRGRLDIEQSSGSNALGMTAGSAINFGNDVFMRSVSHTDGLEVSNWNWGAPNRPKIVAGAFQGTGSMVSYFSGNVGIGTTNPGYKFVVQQAASSGVDIGYGGVNANVRMNMAIGVPGTKALYIGADTSENMIAFGNHAASSGYKWISHNGSAWVESMRIHTNGNVGIGTTAPSSGKLQVDGGVVTAGYFTSTNDSQITLNSTNTWAGIAFDDSGAVNDYIWYDGTNGTFAIGGGGSSVSGKNLHVDGGMTVGANYDATAMAANGLSVEGNIVTGGDLTASGGDVTLTSTSQITAGGSEATYGALTIDGTKAGYGGLNFRSGSTNLGTLMVTIDYQGFYNDADSGWDWYWTNGTLTSGTVPWARLSGLPTYDNYSSWTAQDGDTTTYTITSTDNLQIASGTGITSNFTADDVLTITNTGVTSLAGTANQITASASTGAVTLSIPSDFRAPGTVSAVTGYRVNGAAASGNYLRGNGTNFVSSAIQAGDVPTLNQNTTGTAGSTSLLTPLANYTWDDRITAMNWTSGVQSDFVMTNSPVGSTWPSYGSVLSVKTYSGGGGTFQIYAPYGSSYGGTSLRYRLADYTANTSDPPWTAWKNLWDDTNDGSSSGLNADLLDDYHGSSASTVNTYALRDASGDINSRLFKSEYDSTNATIGYIMTQIDTVSNNYIRPSTPAQLVTGLGLEAGGARDIWVEKAGDTMTGALTISPTLASGTYGLYVTGASGAARSVALIGIAGISNGFTVSYDGANMAYNFAGPGGTVTASTFSGALSGNATTATTATNANACSADGTCEMTDATLSGILSDGSDNMRFNGGYGDFRFSTANSGNYGLLVYGNGQTSYYTNITARDGYAYLADSNTYSNYFLRGDGSDTYTPGIVQSGGSHRAPIFYDTDNTAYYFSSSMRVDTISSGSLSDTLELAYENTGGNIAFYRPQTMKAGMYIYPGSSSGTDFQTSYYLYSNSSYGLQTNTSLRAEGLYDGGNRVCSGATCNIGSTAITSGLINGQTISSAANFTGSLNAVSWADTTLVTNLNADLLDGLHSTTFQQRVSYGTTAQNTGYYKINILPTTGWMLSFTIRLYQGYRYDDIRISGYNYGANYWYTPLADLLNSSATSIDVRFGYDSANNLWVAVPAGNYTGLEIIDIANGYNQADQNWSNNFTIVNQASLTGTVQTTQTVYRPLKYNENAVGLTGTPNITVGTITSGLINGQTISSAANFTGTLTAASTINSTNGPYQIGGVTRLTANSSYTTINDGTGVITAYFGSGDPGNYFDNTTNYFRSRNGGGTTFATINSSGVTVNSGSFNGSGAGLTGTAASLTAGAANTSRELYSKYPYAGSLWITEATTAVTLAEINGGTTTVAMHQSHGLFGSWATTLTMSGYDRYGATQISGEYNATNPRLAIRNYNQAAATWTSWSQIWGSLNDGSGSGLDADLLDGQSYSATWPNAANTVTGAGTTSYLAKFTGASTIDDSVIYESGGNVGIGTTAPVYKLHIVTGGPAIYGYTTSGDGVTGTGSVTGVNGGSPSGIGGYFSSGSGYALVTGIGNVGIGISAPTSKLHVVGTSYLNGTVTTTSTVTLSGIGTGTDNSVVVRNGSNQLVTDEIDSRVWGSTLVDNNSGGGAGYLANFVDANTLAITSIYKTAGGAFGIGTTAPTAGVTLDVLGTVRGYSSGFGIIGETTSAGTSGGYFSASTGYALTTGSGNVGIGTGTPTGGKLHVAGTSYLNGAVTTTGLLTASGDIQAALIQSNAAVTIDLDNNNDGTNSFIVRDGADANVWVVAETGNVTMTGALSGVGNLTATGASITFSGIGSGTYYGPVNRTSTGVLTTATSDIRFKKDVETIPDALSKVMALRGVTFNWKDPNEPKRMMGMIAQETKDIVPELVFQNPVDGYYGINYGETSGLLIEAIKEQQKMINEVTATVAAFNIISGNVGIGTSTPTEKLTVNGNIYVDNGAVIVDGTTLSVPDYVFEADYRLRSLEQLESYISSNSHLPGVASRSEIRRQGMNYGEMMLSILEKTEENTLYIIDNHKNDLDQETKISNFQYSISNVQAALDQSLSEMNLQTMTLEEQLALNNQDLKQNQTLLSQVRTDQAELIAELDVTSKLAQQLAKEMDLLKIQNQAVIDFALAIDPEKLLYRDSAGNLEISGHIKAQDIEALGVISAKEIEAQTLKLEEGETSGKGLIKAGETAIIISTAQATEQAKIYITPVGNSFDKVLYINEISEGESFEVKINSPAEKDIHFNWLIIK